MIADLPSLVRELWPSMLIGLAITVTGAVLGWHAGPYGSWPPVRFLRWWIERVIVPVLRSSSWLCRAGAIFINNSGVLACVVLLGFTYLTGLLGSAALGLSLGIALHILSTQPEALVEPHEINTPRARRRFALGMALNMLEPPAIVLALGLALGRSSVPLPSGNVWRAFAVWIVPALLLAAGGEALWMGAVRGATPDDSGQEESDTENE